jgi:hypothetical protein
MGISLDPAAMATPARPSLSIDCILPRELRLQSFGMMRINQLVVRSKFVLVSYSDRPFCLTATSASKFHFY